MGGCGKEFVVLFWNSGFRPNKFNLGNYIYGNGEDNHQNYEFS